MSAITDNQFHIIGHSLGINVYHAKNSKKKKDKKLPKEYYRNYFQAGPGHDDWDDLLTLVEDGLMWKRKQFGQDVFHVTDNGKELFKDKFQNDVS